MTPRQFAARLENLASDTSREQLAHLLAKETLKLVDQGFRDERDPRGVAWAPTRGGKGRQLSWKAGKLPKFRRRKAGPILQATKAFREGFREIGVNRNGFAIGSPPPYGGFLQHGTVKMPARKTVPDTGSPLALWAEPLKDVARDFIRRKLEGK